MKFCQAQFLTRKQWLVKFEAFESPYGQALLGLVSGSEAEPDSKSSFRPFGRHRQRVPARARQKPPRRQRGFLNSVFWRTVRIERLLFRPGSPKDMPPHLVRDCCVCGMSSDNFRGCETRKGEVWLLKFDWLQRQTRGKTEVSKEG